MPVVVSLVGNLLSTVCFLFLGPAPFLSFPIPSVPLVYSMIAVSGVANAAIAVSSISRAHKAAVEKGFEDNTDTFFVLSGETVLITVGEKGG